MHERGVDEIWDAVFHQIESQRGASQYQLYNHAATQQRVRVLTTLKSRAQEYYQPHNLAAEYSPYRIVRQQSTKVLPAPQKYYQPLKVSARATTSGGWVVVVPVSQPII